jgi:hypothetical protein
MSGGGNKFDPVEEAKIEAPTVPKPRTAIGGTGTPRRDVPPPPLPVKAEPAPVVQAPVPTAPAAPVAKPTPAQAAATKFRVRNDRMISWYGSITHLKAGAIIESSGYGGAPGIERLVSQGVELEPIE